MKDIGKRGLGVATNSILLASVQCLTMITNILQTMILSRELSEFEYGTYSQAMLVVNFLVPFLLLGLSNAITYFSGQKADTKKYTNTIFAVTVLLGVGGCIGILLLRVPLQSYFKNPNLISILPIVAFFPMLINVISLFQSLFVAEGMSIGIAIRNLIVAVVQISIMIIGVYVFKDIHAIFFLMLLMYVTQIYFFSLVFNKKKYVIKLSIADKSTVSEILKFAIPLAFSTAVGTLSIYMDKLLIAKLMTVEDFALYSNMAKELPFSFIVSSFTAVIMPAFVRLHASGMDDELKKYWGKYLELGLYITWTLCGAAIFCADDLLLFLYSDKYSRGIGVFVVYLMVEFSRFSYFGIILNTFGKTKVVLYSSLLSLMCNFILNILLFKVMGMIGPAVASLVTIVLMGLLQIGYSCKLLKCSVFDIVSIRNISLLFFEIVTIGSILHYIVSLLRIPSTLRMFLCGAGFVFLIISLNIKRIKQLISEINSI